MGKCETQRTIIVDSYIPKIFPVENPDVLESVTLRQIGDTCYKDGIVGGLKEDDVKAIQRNHARLLKWSLINQGTLIQINKESEIYLKKLEEKEKKENRKGEN